MKLTVAISISGQLIDVEYIDFEVDKESLITDAGEDIIRIADKDGLKMIVAINHLVFIKTDNSLAREEVTLNG